MAAACVPGKLKVMRGTLADRESTRMMANFAMAFLASGFLSLSLALPASAATLDRVRLANRLVLGYRTDAQPFSYRDASGSAAGYSVALCHRIAEAVKTELGLATLAVEWLPVTLTDRFKDVQKGKVDMLCGADSVTLTRMREVAFSLPIFPGGIGAVLRADAPIALREILAERPPSHRVWRGSPARTLLAKQTASVVKGTTSELWLAERLKTLQIDAGVVQVDSYKAGIEGVLERTSNVFFAERAILLDAVRRSSSEDLIILDRFYTYEPLALAFARGDDDLRLVVDRTLSRLFDSPEFREIYEEWFGMLDESALTFFRLNTLPE